MSNDLSNPFSDLIDPVPPTAKPPAPINAVDQKINGLVERVFMMTVNKNPSKNRPLVFMEDIAAQLSAPLFNLDILDQAIFERILLSNPTDFLLPNDVNPKDHQHIIESRVLVYLHGALLRNARSCTENDLVITQTSIKIRSLIMTNLVTAVKQPDLYEGQNIGQQLIEVLHSDEPDMLLTCDFLSSIVKEVMVDHEPSDLDALRQFLFPTLVEIQQKVRAATLVSFDPWIFPTLQLFVMDRSNSVLANFLLEFTTPAKGSNGAQFADTLFGNLLQISILPKRQNGRAEYFEGMLNRQDTAVSNSLWVALRHHMDSIHALFRGILAFSGPTRAKLLQWIGDCLHANVKRGQLWNSHHPTPDMFGAFTTASDSFMTGLAGVLLRLCKPLLKPELKVLLVDPSYCSVSAADVDQKAVHMTSMDKETCLIPRGDETEVLDTADSYNFVTECFFMTHKALDLSYRVCIEQFFNMNREIGRHQSAYQNAVTRGQTEAAQSIMDIMQTQFPQIMCLQSVLLEPTNDQILLQFHEASSIWLSQLTHREIVRSDRGFAPVTIEGFSLPLTGCVPKVLKSIPEFIVENIVGYLTFIRHFDIQNIDTDPEAQKSLFTMILIFMGDANRVKNPHLRARLAEGLESLLPKTGATSSFRSDWRRSLFTQHPHRHEIVRSLLSVFVGIEVTGQSVQFEQKFNYRRPMYIIMDYLWSIPEQQECFKQLARQAEHEMENVDPPLFLRFINLLINDAIFLLDESLSNLQQIRTLQNAQAAGEWETIPAQERQQNLANMQHLGMMARFDNILGRDTINMLKLLTTEIDGIFCHASMVDRVAAMLNYFLLHLVGPNKGNFKVKDKKEFEFDPARTVLEICSIYINLEKSDAFALAVSQDGRSYSAQLFEFAEQVLVRIGGGLLIGELNEFSKKVSRLERLEKVHQEALTDAPDEYLDPIMSTLMLDPVTLPSSHVTVDRTTIARHLLSDQSDPFNRSPLTMDQVQPNVELRDKIDQWVRDKKAAYQTAQNAVQPEE